MLGELVVTEGRVLDRRLNGPIGSPLRHLVALGVLIFAIAGCGSGTAASSTGVATTMSAVPAPPSNTASQSAAATTVRTAQTLASIKVGNLATGMVAGPTGIWVTTDAGIVRIDPATNQVVTSYPLPARDDGYGLAVGSDALWLTDFDTAVVFRMDPLTGKRGPAIASPPGPGPIAIFDGEVWFGGHHAGNINRIDPKTNTIIATVPVDPPGGGGPDWIVPIDQGLWVGFGDYNKVVEVDPKTAKVTRTVVIPDANTSPFEAGPGRVWVSYFGDTQGIAMLDASLNTAPTHIDVGGVPGNGAIINGGAVWVPVLLHSTDPAGELVAIDPSSNRLVGSLSFADGAAPDQVLQAFGSEWVELGLEGTIDRLAPTALTVSP